MVQLSDVILGNVLFVMVNVFPDPDELYGVTIYIYGKFAVNPVSVNVVPVTFVAIIVPFLVILTFA